jgi:hypothetical protein
MRTNDAIGNGAAVAFDGKNGKGGGFKSTVPVNAIRPKPAPIPPKTVSR